MHWEFDSSAKKTIENGNGPVKILARQPLGLRNGSRTLPFFRTLQVHGFGTNKSSHFVGKHSLIVNNFKDSNDHKHSACRIEPNPKIDTSIEQYL